MPKKIGQKKWRANTNFNQKRKRFFRCLWFSSVLLLVNFLMPAGALLSKAEAVSCPDLKIIFVRGSGAERWTDRDYLEFKRAMVDKLALTHINYSFEDLDYPAVSVANPLTLLTTFISGGEAYEFGASVQAAVNSIMEEFESSECLNTRYVLAGYSQGAMVVSKVISHLSSNRIIYAATFGDPKLYLPEGAGLVPSACKGQNLSNYRIYVPDCRAYYGMLGGYNPYQTADYIDKMGTWCNKADFFCSSYLNVKDHLSYVEDGIYEEASKTIFSKITEAFAIDNKYISPHDTAILIDSTGSMDPLIEKYRFEAINLAEKTFLSGGRVALYDYRDLADGYEPTELCNFETCTLENFSSYLYKIHTAGGGDVPESLLSSGLKMMQKLNWSYGATKSVVVLTDAPYHNPDLDGTTFEDVVNLSKKIDPVNFYFVVPNDRIEDYESFAAATDGAVVSAASDLSILTNTIISRYDSLPRIEEDLDLDLELPEILASSVEKIDDSSVKVSWTSTGSRVMVALNDYVLGVTEGNSLTINDLDFTKNNTITLAPMNDSRRGIGVDIELKSEGRGDMIIPKAPNTGKL